MRAIKPEGIIFMGSMHYVRYLSGYVDGQELKDVKPAHPIFFCFLEP